MKTALERFMPNMALTSKRAAWRRLVAMAMLLVFVAMSLASVVHAAPLAAGTLLRNVAHATYVPDGYVQTESVDSNAVVASISPVEALTLFQGQSVKRPPGVQVLLSHLLTNTGNVLSAYSLNWLNNGAGCSVDNFDLAGLRVVQDANNNGVADANEPSIPLATPGALSLPAGRSVSLLVLGNMPNVSSGFACLTLTATTVAQGISATNQDIVEATDLAVVSLTKMASYSGFIVPGSSRIDFTVNGTNIGASEALPTANAAPGGLGITVDGNPMALVLIRDAIPVGTRYIAGSLQSPMPGVLRLFRLPGDPPFNYRSAVSGDQARAEEVAIGLPFPLARNASVSLQFSVDVKPDASQDILNIARAYYLDGVQSVTNPSNLVDIPLDTSWIGVAKSAGVPRLNRDGNGDYDGTADVTFSVRLKNYGTTTLYDVQAEDLLEGAAPTQFGSYVSAVVPAANQYTVIPGSLEIVGGNGSVGGVVAAVDAAFQGTSARSRMLAPGAVLPVGGEINLRFTVRGNLTGRSAPLLNTVQASAALLSGGGTLIRDESVDGSDPDLNADGNPTNDTSPTPVPLPQFSRSPLSIVKSAGLPRQISPGVFEIDYSFRVSNQSQSETATNVRVIDNLNCTFLMDQVGGPVASWSIVSGVRVQNGILTPAASFTGSAPCDRSKQNSSDPFQFPTELALNMTDGLRSLGPAQSETLSFTVRVNESASAIGTRITVTNKAWLAALTQNSVVVLPSMIVGAAQATAASTLADPQGTVYDAVTRQPVAGARVTIARQSCTTGSAGPISASQLVDGGSGVFTFNSNGTVSMTTGADGTWQFYFKSPPVSGLCTYSISVTPPAGSSYVYPSALIPAQSGSFNTCGAIVPNVAPPQNGEPTTHYFAMVSGFNPDGSPCDVVHNHIPLDPGAQKGLVLRKEANKKQVEFGDFLTYALQLTNKTGSSITGFSVSDTLPPGFAYIAGSSRVAGDPVADPAGGSGPQLTWAFPTTVLAVDQSMLVRYRVRVGVGARINGSATNRAQVAAGWISSNEATHTVQVTGGVFSDEAFAFGKVFLDCQADGVQSPGAGEIGVPGVRLFMEDGTMVVTDSEGKWSLYGLKPITHVLRLDQTTLPTGTAPRILDNRNGNDAASRFVDLKAGEFHKANFPLDGCADKTALEEIESRRKAAASRAGVEGEAVIRGRLDPAAKTLTVADPRTLPASGQVAGGGAMIQPQITPPSRPLIELPAGSANNPYINSASAAGQATGTLGSMQQATPFGAVAAIPGGTTGLLGEGVGSGVGTVGSNGINPHSGRLAPEATPLLPQGAPTVVELEQLMHEFDPEPAFVELKDGDTVPFQAINVRVKGPEGASLNLSVNGVALDGKRVGKKATLPSRHVTAWEYIGVQLKPGRNVLRLDIVDDFGVARGRPQEITVIAPDKLGLIHLDVPREARADLRTPVPVKIRLTDAADVPVTTRTALTLEASAGRWLENDLNPSEPGHQVFIEGGSGEFNLLPPGTPGDARIRVSTGIFVKEVRLALLPDLRPMIAVGIVEGVLDLSGRGKIDIGQTTARAAFERELRSVSDGDNSRVGARAAFFLKGAIKGEYLLTAAVDTDKSNKDRLFRDIRPDEFYPIYGDASARGFDAQSSQRFYVRIDKNRSYLLFGDFTTASSPEVRKLSQTNRTLTGLKHVYETENMRITTHASHTDQTQQIEEFQAKGISGPYYLAHGGASLVENSEKVEIIVRDRNQQNAILQITPLTRFVDYTIEVQTGRLLFTRPIASVDANLNPQSIRVTYEISSGGPKYVVAGTDAQFKVGDNLQLGVVLSQDDDPKNPRKLGAVTALARVGDNTTVAGEVVRTESELKGKGSAMRGEVRYQNGDLGLAAQAARSDVEFDNPAAGFAAGRTDANLRAEYKLSERSRMRGEAVYSKDEALTGVAGSTKGVSASVQTKLTDTLTGELGIRHGRSSTATASLFDYNQVSSVNGAQGGSVTSLGGSAAAAAASGNTDQTTVRARLTANISELPRAQVFVEGEQDITNSSRNMAAIGANYAITDKTRLYGRYEFLSNLGNQYATTNTGLRNVGVLGVESNYMEGGRIYNEYRLSDALDNRTGQAALGIRNTFKLNDRWRATLGAERTMVLGNSGATVGQSTQSASVGESIALVSGIEYLGTHLKGSAILEGRHATDSDTVLASGGIAYKINPDLSLLARSTYSSSRGNGAAEGDERTLSRTQLGMAYRPVNDDRWNALARYERRTESVRGAGTVLGTISGNTMGFGSNSAPGDYVADIVSAHFNLQPGRSTQVMGRVAAKWASDDDGVQKLRYSAQLIQGRLIHDIDKNWDVGVQAGYLRGSGGAQQIGLGVEVGYQLYRNLWASAGYNFIGLEDRDLTAGEYTSKGAFLRLRYKFDETSLGFEGLGKRGGALLPASAVDKPEPRKSEPAAAVEPIVPILLVDTTLNTKGIKLSDDVLFDFGAHALNAQGKATLEEVVRQIADTDYEFVLVVGHTDSKGSDNYNQKLSERRADAVQAFLKARGIPGNRIRAEGRGEREPLASNATSDGRAFNRRVEVLTDQNAVVLPKGATSKERIAPENSELGRSATVQLPPANELRIETKCCVKQSLGSQFQQHSDKA